MSTPAHIFDLDLTLLEDAVNSWGWPRFRAGQILDWVYRKGVADPQQMSNLSLSDRKLIGQHLAFNHFKIDRHQSATDGTQKLLLEMIAGQAPVGAAEPADGPPASGRPASCTECVLIPSTSDTGRARRTACISSQVGCPVGCRFCASGIGGLEKNLSAGQIVEQVWWLNQIGARLADSSPASAAPDDQGSGCRVTHIVFMGMGEPLSNFENVTRAIRTLTAPWAFGISGRRITVSTVGLPSQIRRLASIDVPLTLAISLHAPNDELRRQLIPWAQYTTIDALVEAGRVYFEKTGREVTLEYIMLRNVNDRPEHARQLAQVARQLRSNVNLIRYNEVRGLPFDRPMTEDVHRFQQILRDQRVNVHIRASRGRDIAAACGQLRHEAASSV
jgi:23S rRNA (adenine2503-C2)-methyltransferase